MYIHAHTNTHAQPTSDISDSPSEGKNLNDDETAKDEEDTPDKLEEGGGGFGGIVMSSVQDTIARARIAEAFVAMSAAGLSDNLEDLAKLVEEEEEESEL